MEYINKVTLCGKVGNVRTTNNGVFEFTQFTIVTNCVVESENYNVVESTWFNVLSLKPLTILKGDSVLVEGKMRTMRYQDKDGEDRYAMQVVATSVEKVDDVTLSK